MNLQNKYIFFFLPPFREMATTPLVCWEKSAPLSPYLPRFNKIVLNNKIERIQQTSYGQNYERGVTKCKDTT